MGSRDYIGLLFNQNAHWATSVEEERPGYFTRLVNQKQNPQYLWIGCSDSRVPANSVVGFEPGELFVHRNVANVAAPNDVNCFAVIQFALESLHVKHIMIVGHYACSGVAAALQDGQKGMAGQWLQHVRVVRDKHGMLLDQIQDDERRKNALCELNAIEQAAHVCESRVVLDAWERGQEVYVHGLVYALHNGLMQDLGFAVSNEQEYLDVYRKSIKALYEKYLTSGGERTAA